jgi:arylsulfatase
MRTLLLSVVLAGLCGVAGSAAADTKPNIMFIMGDDIGWMQVGAYHQGIGLGETPNIDRLANEGGKFTTYYALEVSSCTRCAGRDG